MYKQRMNKSNTDPKAIVRAGYDLVSRAYRGDSLSPGDPALSQYASWLGELAALIPPGARVLDLGCGNGVPAARMLAEAGFAVTGVDLSPVQIERARANVPEANFICADMAELAFPPETFAAIVSFYAIIHLPRAEQPGLLTAIAGWLRPSGYLLATLGADAWTGTEDDWLGVAGGRMYWSHADAATYARWCAEAGLDVCWTRFVPEGQGGHTLLLAQRRA